MATATIAKTAPAVRRHRPSISTRNNYRNTVPSDDDGDEERTFSEPPQEGTFSYKSEMRIFIEHLVKQTIPHELIDEFLRSGVQFYDGCLIVEVHNHRIKDVKTQKKVENAETSATTIPFSIHNYNEHVTPSPYVPFPRRAEEPPSKKLKHTPELEESEKDKKAKEEMPAPEIKPRKTNEPQKYTTVLFPTDLSRHHELLFLASTPAPDPKARKASRDSATPQTPSTTSAQAASRNGNGKPTKMLLEEKDVYTFEAEYLLSTEPPLQLGLAKDISEARKILNSLAHPLHSGSAPSTQSRKRTQADIAADDAQAAREEHKMLIMDERVKPSVGTAAGGDSQNASATLGFTRFKTLETIKQRHEEKERQRKEDEARHSLEKRQADQQKKKAAEEAQQRKIAADAHQQQQQQQQLMMRQQAMKQHQQNQQLQQQISMAQNPQQQALQQQVAMNHSSPIVRNQTPMMNSSPMTANASLLQGGFPMQNSASNQGVGSPLRPSSAMHHPSVGMARQVSQQQHSSRNGTPQLAGATPHMANSVPIDINRQMTATPRISNGSPAQNMQGTPNTGMMNMATPQMNGQTMTPQQIAFLQQQQVQRRALQQMQASNMSPEQMQMQMRQQQMARANANMNNQQNQYQQQMQRFQALAMQNNQRQQQQQMQQQQPQVHTPGGQPGGEAMAHSASQNPNLSNDMSQRQATIFAQQAQQARNNAFQQQAAQQHGGQVPAHIKAQIMQQSQQRLLAQQQQISMRARQAAQANQGLDVNDTENYMRNLRGQQAMYNARMNAQQGGGTPGGQQMQPQQSQQQNMGMGRGAGQGMTMQQMQALQQMRQAQQMQQQQQQQNQSGDLSQQFAAMQQALNLQHAQQGGKGM
ncbi:hypothetical protein K461DRAFT_280807 [Myriangium duriaei CBS 260.36]|uniref:Spt20-like SEP domain-containing protein n=1 Tax=Myriangium duriaei CBS 260.36 TaxID=1168546 RepID=A0A9P4MKG9_9PEZI|nr:hypothetical protein K461DRAFT_280807 [Myriangium duriaei CBS 260.36]